MVRFFLMMLSMVVLLFSWSTGLWLSATRPTCSLRLPRQVLKVLRDPTRLMARIGVIRVDYDATARDECVFLTRFFGDIRMRGTFNIDKRREQCHSRARSASFLRLRRMRPQMMEPEVHCLS